MNRDFRFRRRMSWPLSAKHAELDSRQARMAVSDTSAQRAYSAGSRPAAQRSGPSDYYL
jgi:hypothetical protein